MAIKPILFNTEMVKAIMEGRKTQTRRVIKPVALGMIYEDSSPARKPPYKVGDVLWVRETWCRWWMPHGEWHYCYKASDPNGNKRPTGPEYDDDWETRPWRPSIHMPKEAARIFLRVKAVRVERLQDMKAQDSLDEGVKLNLNGIVNGADPLLPFAELWNSTIRKEEFHRYCWSANPWVWVIKFERMEAKPWEKLI